MNPPGHMAALLAICPGATEKHEAGNRFVYLPALKVPIGERVFVMDGLLAVTSHSGYSTRLFLAEQITERPTINGQAANWTSHQILGRNWWSWSWRDVESNLPWIQILHAHLRALK